MKTTSTAVKAVLFVVVTSLAAVFVAVLAGNLRFGPTREYHAIFSTAAGLTTGSEVRIAGVPVGTVTGVELAGKDAARVDFTLDTAHSLSDTTHAVIRYKNLIGDRYLQLTEPEAIGQPESEGSTIPQARTTPALDVDQVVNGFKPLLQGSIRPRPIASRLPSWQSSTGRRVRFPNSRLHSVSSRTRSPITTPRSERSSRTSTSFSRGSIHDTMRRINS